VKKNTTVAVTRFVSIIACAIIVSCVAQSVSSTPEPNRVADELKKDVVISTGDGITDTANLNAPVLSSPSCSPEIGSQATTFTFRAVYTDADNDAPSSITIQITTRSTLPPPPPPAPPVNGTMVPFINVTIFGVFPIFLSIYPMTKQIASDVGYTDGCAYEYSTTLSSCVNFIYEYYISCNDGVHSTNTSKLAGPAVCFENLHPPTISNISFDSPSGTNTTLFTFSATYADADNMFPASITIVLDSGPMYPMCKADILDRDARDGVQYVVATTLPYNVTWFHVACNDSQYATNSSWQPAPSMNPYNVLVDGTSIFQEQFPCSYLLPDGWTWSNDGYYGWVYPMSYPWFTPPCSLMICGNTTCITSKPIDATGLDLVTVSFWARSDNFYSSQLHIEYRSISGAWANLTVLSASYDTFTPRLILPADARHAAFQLRFRVESLFYQWPSWYIDCVDIRTYFSSPILLAPTNGSIIYTESINFTWRSISLLDGPSTYTFQLSFDPGFTTIITSMKGIHEELSTTGIEIMSNLEPGVYYWRIQPLCGPFKGPWLDDGLFINNPGCVQPVIRNLVVTNSIAGDDEGTGTAPAINFLIRYQHGIDIPPASIVLVLDGIEMPMHQADVTDIQYADGCIYEASCLATLADGYHEYYVICNDGGATVQTAVQEFHVSRGVIDHPFADAATRLTTTILVIAGVISLAVTTVGGAIWLKRPRPCIIASQYESRSIARC
jgi:hypothetical protein